MITKKDIREFKLLYRQSFGIELDNDTAHQKLNVLVRQVGAITNEYVNESEETNEQKRSERNSKNNR